jgi:hypothetical protein
MTQGNLTTFALSQSGQPFAVPNGANVAAGGSLVVNYNISGAPSSMTVYIEGVKNSSGGSVALLDTYSSTANVSARSVGINDIYDSFKVTATWTGGANVRVAASISASGPGLAWNSGTLPAVQNRSF